MNWKWENFTLQTDSVTPVAISVARMFTRVALFCACALVASIFAIPAPPRRDNKGIFFLINHIYPKKYCVSKIVNKYNFIL